MSPVPSPCTRECVLEGSLCTGCGRTIEEIINWSHFTDEEKETIIKRVCPSLLSQDTTPT